MHIDKETLEEWDAKEAEYRSFLKAVKDQIVIALAIWILVGTIAITWAVMSIR